MASNPHPPFSVVRQPSLPDENIVETDESSQYEQVEAGREKKQYSTVEFPYGDLEDAVILVKKMFKEAGTTSELSRLAAILGHESVKSGTFRMRLSTAKMFGLIETDARIVRLAPLGTRIVDADAETEAKAEAFLKVELYRKLFQKFDGAPLPSGAGLENEMEIMGVAPKQKDRARQAFQRSALYAGYFAYGNNKLVKPLGIGAPKAAAVEVEERHGSQATPSASASQAPKVMSRSPSFGGSNGGIQQGTHPLIQAAVQTLPPAGGTMTNQQLEWWVENFRGVLRMAYTVPPDGSED